MPRHYTVNFSPTSETVAVDLVALVAADDIPIRIRSLRVWQISDVGDAQDEILTVLIVRGNTTPGSGGAAATPAVVRKDAAASFTARVGDTTAASSGAASTVYSNGFNVRGGMSEIFPDTDMRGTDQGAGFLVVRLAAAPADAVTIGCAVDVWEMD